jgi:hypothetical protein
MNKLHGYISSGGRPSCIGRPRPDLVSNKAVNDPVRHLRRRTPSLGRGQVAPVGLALPLTAPHGSAGGAVPLVAVAVPTHTKKRLTSGTQDESMGGIDGKSDPGGRRPHFHKIMRAGAGGFDTRAIQGPGSCSSEVPRSWRHNVTRRSALAFRPHPGGGTVTLR